MKARVKATGDIVDVYCDFQAMKYDFLDETGKGYMSNELVIFDNEDYEQGWNDGYYEAISTNHDADYWTRLEHQYAGMAMQGMLMNEKMMLDLHRAFGKNESMDITVSEFAIDIAHTLVEKMKEERK